MIFAVFDPSPLTVCINCSFFTFITFSDHQGHLPVASLCQCDFLFSCEAVDKILIDTACWWSTFIFSWASCFDTIFIIMI